MSTSLDWIRQRCPYILLAGLFLALTEASWLLAEGHTIDVPRFGILVAASVVAALIAVLAVETLYCGAGCISSRWAPLLVSLASLPLVISATVSLFSGEAFQRTSGAGYIRFGFGLSLFAIIYGAAVLVPRISNTTSKRTRIALQAACLTGMSGFSYVDTHLFVEIYPAFHYLAMAGAIGCASLAARLLLPPKAQPRIVGSVSTVLTGIAAIVWALTWHAPETSYLTTYSHGVLPKLRSASLRLIQGPPPRTGVQVSTPREGAVPGDIRLTPTMDQEVTELRKRVQNVVLVVADALRADHVSKVQDGHSLTPHFDALKKEAIDFTYAYSPGSFTGQAIPPLMSSFNVPVVASLAEFEVSLVSWIEHLTPTGYRSFANGLCNHVTRSPMFRIDVADCFGAETIGSTNGRDDNLVSEVLAFAGQQQSSFAVYTHWLDAHVPYTEIETYPEMVRRVDSRLGNLMSGLRAAGLWENTLFVVTADHGYFLGEGNRRANGGCCSDIQMRVPLIVRLPRSRFAGQQVETLVTTAQVPVTIVDLLAPDRRPPVGAESLLRTLYASDGSAPPAVYAGDDTRGMLRTGSHKLFWDTQRDVSLVYDLTADPRERSPVTAPSVVRDLELQLSRARERHAEQSVFLIKEAKATIPAEVLKVALAEDIDLRLLSDLMSRFWQYKSETRLYLVETIFVRDVKDAGPALESVVRDQDQPDDDLLDVMLPFVSVPGACDELAQKVRALEPHAKSLLGEVIVGLPDECLSMLLEPLQDEIERVHATTPPLDSDEGRFVTLATYGLAQRLGANSSESMKRVLRDVHNQHAATRTSLSTLRDVYFDSADLMLALDAVTTFDDLAILETLTITAHSSRRLYQKCAASTDKRCESILLDIARKARGSDLAFIVADLENRPASSWSEEFRATARSRFPELFRDL